MSADAAFWNKLAEEYAAKPVDDPDAFERKIRLTKARMSPQDKVLDVGCGTGSLALRLADHGAEIHGFDVSSEMVRIARHKTQGAGVDNVHFHVGAFDGELPFEPESFDGLLAYSFLHLVEDRDAALARIYSLLKPGGFFISSTVCLRESWVPYTPILTVMRWVGKAPMVKVVSKRDVAADIERAGFIEVSQPDVGAENIIGFMTATKPR